MWTRWSAIGQAHSPGIGTLKTRRPGLPVMMVTVYGDERRRHAAEASALQFLSKPADFDQLKQELRRLSATPI